MPSQRIKMTIAIFFAFLLAILLVALSYSLFPEPIKQPSMIRALPNQESIFDQLLWVIQWVGLAAIIALVFTASVFIIVRIRQHVDNAKDI